MELLFALCLAVGLGACAGLRTFLPLFLLGLAVRMQFPMMGLTEGEAALWLASNLALVVFGILACLECLLDMVPVVDSALDVPNFALAPLAGGFAAFSVLGGDPGMFWFALVLSLLIGALVSLPVHTTSTTVRVVSTATTAGTANPLLSIKETLLSVFGVIGFLLLAPLMLAGAIVFGVVLFRWLRGKMAAREAEKVSSLALRQL